MRTGLSRCQRANRVQAPATDHDHLESSGTKCIDDAPPEQKDDNTTQAAIDIHEEPRSVQQRVEVNHHGRPRVVE